jgi:hypothetical protein
VSSSASQSIQAKLIPKDKKRNAGLFLQKLQPALAQLEPPAKIQLLLL